MIRLATYEDAQSVSNIYAPYVLDSATSFETVAPRAEEMWGRMKNVLEEAPWLVYELDGQVVGYAYAGKHRERSAYQWTREVSVYLDREYHGQGIGTKLYKELFSLLEKQGFTNMLAGITLPNDASVALHAKMGFTEVGTYQRVGFKNNQFWDVIWLEKSLHQQDPGPLLSLEDIGYR